VIVGALATKTAGILSSSSPHEVFGGSLKSDRLLAIDDVLSLFEFGAYVFGLAPASASPESSAKTVAVTASELAK
jgi:hypothetical protein